MFTNKLKMDSIAEAVKKVMKDEESGLRMAAHAAHKSGKKMFTFQGKTYPVKVQGEQVSYGEAIQEDKDEGHEDEAEDKKMCKDIAKKEVKKHEKERHGSKGDVAQHVKKMHKEETFKDRLIEAAYAKKSPMIDEDEDEKSEDAKEHYKKHVLPLYREHGLSPTFANAVNAHVKKYGIHQVWNHHSIDGTSMPSWFDTKVNRVKPLKQTYTHEHVEQVQEGEPSYYKGKSHTGNALPPPGSFADMKRTGNTLLKGFKSNPQPIKPYVAPKKQVDEVSQSEVDKFHKKLDTLVHSTFGKSSKEKKMKEDVEQMDEANLLHVKVGEKVRLTNPKSPASHTVDKIDGQDVHITKNDGKKVVMPLERIKRIKYQASKLGEDIEQIDEVGDTEKGRQALTRLIGARVQDPKGKHGLEGVKRALKRLGPARKLRGEEVEELDEKNKSHTHAAHYENDKGEWVGMNLLVAKDDEDAIRQAHEKCKKGCRLSRVERHIPVKEEVELDEAEGLDSFLKSRGMNPKTMNREKKSAWARSDAFKTWAQNRPVSSSTYQYKTASEETEIDEKVREPYAIGMAAAKKQAGITRTHDLPKSVIKKGHEIAKKVMAREALEPPFEPDVKKSNVDVTDKSGAKHSAMSRVRHLARQALEKQKKMKKEMIGKAGMTSEETDEE